MSRPGCLTKYRGMVSVGRGLLLKKIWYFLLVWPKEISHVLSLLAMTRNYGLHTPTAVRRTILAVWAILNPQSTLHAYCDLKWTNSKFRFDLWLFFGGWIESGIVKRWQQQRLTTIAWFLLRSPNYRPLQLILRLTDSITMTTDVACCNPHAYSKKGVH